MFGGFDRSPEPPRMAEINVTPLVDVMLVLLVVFIITAPLLAHSLLLDLPEEKAPLAETSPAAIQLAIDAQGDFFWNGVRIDEAQLRERLAQAARGAGEKPEIQLRADKATRYERVARVMAAAQQVGLTRLGFVTEPTAQP
ncbi:MAG: biopolymer transporter ExbD [Burkholderiaceae bacterium]